MRSFITTFYPIVSVMCIEIILSVRFSLPCEWLHFIMPVEFLFCNSPIVIFSLFMGQIFGVVFKYTIFLVQIDHLHVVNRNIITVSHPARYFDACVEASIACQDSTWRNQQLPKPYPRRGQIFLIFVQANDFLIKGQYVLYFL